MGVGSSIKHQTERFIRSKHMLSALTAASFLESIIVPIPLEAVMVPLMQARRDKIWLIALMATLGCIAGALVGYGVGYFLFDAVGQWLIDTFFSAEQYQQVEQQMQSKGFWFVLSVGIVPIPFQIAMLAAGATKYSLSLYLLATLIARSLRYFGLALVVYYAGNHAQRLLKRYKTKAIVVITIVIAVLWWLLN